MRRSVIIRSTGRSDRCDTRIVDAIERVDPSDTAMLEAALDLTRRSFASMDGVIDPPSSIHRLTVEDLVSGPGEVWVIGTPPIATVTLTPRTDVLYLGKLAVDESARGQGLARRLVDWAEQRTVQLGLPAIELQTRIELVDNQRTFVALGFSEIARTAHAGYDRTTSITYRRPVPG